MTHRDSTGNLQHDYADEWGQDHQDQSWGETDVEKLSIY